ncbi:DUF1778 domain-containing protein [Frankia sp. Cj3]|uniref:type II toxin-antitoxin system TacA family antitoxin n=1 Tax=Frankia sp. Cj3 TaxID=2880976 RepID=UPI001EF51C37|nr:DUF1778 domain-containing protein [Frankia sp. Cj3]
MWADVSERRRTDDPYAYQAHTRSMTMVKSSRIAVRLPEEQDALIRAAAEAEGSTVTEFTVNAAVARAKDVLADQRLLTLGNEAWAEFLTVLDRPVTRKPRLERLFAEESLFE